MKALSYSYFHGTQHPHFKAGLNTNVLERFSQRFSRVEVVPFVYVLLDPLKGVGFQKKSSAWGAHGYCGLIKALNPNPLTSKLSQIISSVLGAKIHSKDSV